MRRKNFQTLPCEDENSENRGVLEQLKKLGIVAKHETLTSCDPNQKESGTGITQTIFIYKDQEFFAMSTCLSNPSLIPFLKDEFKIS